MYFTKEQIQEIAQRLSSDAKRDTDFREIEPDFSKDIYVAVIENGRNKRLKLNYIDDIAQDMQKVLDREVLLTQEEFDVLEEHGAIDPEKVYLIYEEDE